ncbi:hypothetical protein GDO81_024124 [Engystomops pustulosus]|uniref:Uncharacterized protein n=1 Tax=Engystomops pustulosus TaxID=76066 RepID=A0AAV6YNL1_ENGPU|nr:hypothetical protein GDO81_024124 [Engystomops pustulosus]
MDLPNSGFRNHQIKSLIAWTEIVIGLSKDRRLLDHWERMDAWRPLIWVFANGTASIAEVIRPRTAMAFLIVVLGCRIRCLIAFFRAVILADDKESVMLEEFIIKPRNF